MTLLTPMLAFVLLTGQSSSTQTFPQKLAGEWRYGTVSGTTHWDSSSGKYLGHGGGMSDTIVFSKDGSFKAYAYIQNSPTAGWTTKIFTTTEGKAEVDGDMLKLIPTKGNYKVEDNRVARSNYDRPMTAEEVKKQARTYRFSIREIDGKNVLIKHLGKEEMKYLFVK